MDYDIVISGGGIAGLTAAAAFGQAGFTVLCVDPTPPATSAQATGADLRTTAFLQPSQRFLAEAGLWERLAPHAMPLQVMRIIDAGGAEPEARVTRDFDADEISDLPFGWNLPNWLLRHEIAQHLETCPGVTYRPGTATTDLFTRQTEARVSLSDESRVTCRLVVAADGRNSLMRRAAGIGVKTHHFGQKALAFAVTHPEPHQNVSTEVHRTGGPFTLVPLPDREGQPCSAVVWMEEGPRAEALAQMEIPGFEAEMTRRSTGFLGPLTLASRRSVWPIIAQEAQSLQAERLALVAEAAHVVPPIGAQGLNMSLKDMITLRDLAVARPEGLGDAAMLDAYARARKSDVALRVAGITALNRVSMLAPRPLRDLRAAGLSALYGSAPVRKGLMRLGLGTGR